MSVEEMKSEVVRRINQLQTEEAFKEILNYLKTMHDDNELKQLSADKVFEDAQKKYDNLFKRLA